eukprot:11726083-Alexandrium_andersonii.AAC.1
MVNVASPALDLRTFTRAARAAYAATLRSFGASRAQTVLDLLFLDSVSEAWFVVRLMVHVQRATWQQAELRQSRTGAAGQSRRRAARSKLQQVTA